MVYIEQIAPGIAPREVVNDMLFPIRNKGLNTLESLIKRLTRNLGLILKSNANQNHQVEYKKEDDPVTNLDRQIEIIAKKYLLENGDFNFIGEEYGFEDNGAEKTVIIDPLDGTKSYIKKIFDSSVSIAVEKEGDLVCSAVYDFMRNNMYFVGYGNNKSWTIDGSTARPLTELKNEILVSGKANSLIGKLQERGIKSKSQEGSIALSMAQTAMGLYGGIAVCNPGKGAVWDVAAGYHLLACQDEFVITDFNGEQFNYRDPKNGFIAINKNIMSKLNGVFYNG